VIHGALLTGERPKYLSARITGGHGFSSVAADVADWSPATKIAARHLAPYLERRERLARSAAGAV
jgi:hypothetical protein